MGEIGSKISVFVGSKQSLISKLALALFLFIVIYFSFQGITTTPEQKQEIDSLVYHIPIAKHFAKGNIFTAPDLPHGLGYYPSVGEAILSIFVFLGIPLNLYNVLAITSLFIITYFTAKEFRLDNNASIIFATSVSSLNTITRLISTQTIDIWLTVFFFSALYLLKRPRNSYSYYMGLGIIFGLLIGVKYSGMIYVATLILIFGKKVISKLNFNRLIALFTPMILLGAYWFIRNFIYTANPFYPITILGFMGNPTMLVIPVWASFSTLPGLMLNLEAFISEYLIWSLMPLFLVYILFKFRKEIGDVKKLMLLGFLNLIPYLVYPSDFFSRIIITSNYRFTYPAMMPLMFSLFIIAKKYKFELKLAVISILSTFAVLLQFSYRPKIIFIWLVLIIIINNFHKAFKK